MTQSPCRIINATAPIRICDLGGWTDTWFSGHGSILNIGVYPYAEAQLFVRPGDRPGKREVMIHAENFGERYALPTPIEYDKHPLLEACLDIMELPDNLDFEVNLFSIAPPGCSTGTSAAISVALLGALDLLTPGRMTPHEIALLAQRVETEKLGLQCGIQDQLCSAYGGICYIDMYEYPNASVSQLWVPNRIWWELERRLVLVYLGRSHSSSEVHGKVIAGFEAANSDKSALEPLRRAATAAKDALYQGDFLAFGKAMKDNTEAQRNLHPALISAEAEAVIDLARKHGALGWKINGAGGQGGSVTILCGPENTGKRNFIKELSSINPAFEALPIYLSRFGLRQWKSPMQDQSSFSGSS
ncbi:MAG TPA: GHMP kinase [Candidatus Hydrogenedentes bacterium]|jgi:D-glycero-alpha-D-manno-heptose-7-phosphate kinase|nr:MAG: D-glycero-alpha-D-manno-heptose 7-phosphate kinase [Candidatus Hydrogenedentes bacterium ADurb.Bin170]HNZ49289.1 GHMP kinase [Candidatus Hydrogenedentota bacterium]HOD94790.1 GHMP kinase [Candidatus Hydrogenedentota bacterium]HOH42069.1 GHMP kinase [Candidatus Hydrogenedentota bacterium]HOM47498.1 GHMP kinase [Candidatus Hydrogenedentota bacterium]